MQLLELVKRQPYSYVIVFIIAFLLCVSNIWDYPITILDEAKNAEAAREMWLNRSLVPTFNDLLRTDKPPLHYFFMSVGYSFFGVNTFGARIFGALLGAGVMTYFFVFLKRYSTMLIARVATFVLLSSFFWIQEFHLAVPDPYLLGFMCTSWLFFFSYYKNGNTTYLWLFYLFVGFATLAKGPVAIGLSGLIVLAFLIAKKELNLKNLRRFKPIVGGLLILLIFAPWFIWVHMQTDGAFTDGFFLKHNLQRFSSTMEGHGGIFLITWGFVVLGLFPFGAFIPQALWHGFKFRKRNDLTLFSWIISLIIIIFFSISSTKLPNYTLPAMPFLAILVASFWDEVLTFKTLKKWWNVISLIIISIVTLGIPVANFILFRHSLIFQYQLELTLLFLCIAILGLGFMWKAYIDGKVSRLVKSVGLTWIIIGLCIFYCVYPKLSQIEPVVMASQVVHDQNIVVYKSYDPSFNFNYQTIYPIFDNEDELIRFIKVNPNYLVLTKDRAMQNSELLNRFDIIFNQPSVFENYRTIILRRNNN